MNLPSSKLLWFSAALFSACSALREFLVLNLLRRIAAGNQ